MQSHTNISLNFTFGCAWTVYLIVFCIFVCCFWLHQSAAALSFSSVIYFWANVLPQVTLLSLLLMTVCYASPISELNESQKDIYRRCCSGVLQSNLDNLLLTSCVVSPNWPHIIFLLDVDVKLKCDAESPIEVHVGENVTIHCTKIPNAQYRWTKVRGKLSFRPFIKHQTD